jgi:hypothetical protein
LLIPVTYLILGLLQDTEQHKEVYLKEENGPAKKKAFIAIQRTLVKCQEIGDEKLHLLTLIHEFIENRHRQLDQDRENLGILFGKLQYTH